MILYKVNPGSSFEVLEHPMLHTKFQGHRLFGSGEEDFFRFYHIWAWRSSWLSCYLVTVWTNFRSSIPEKLHMKFHFDGPVVSEEMFKECGRRTDDGGTTDDRDLPIL